MMQEKERDGEKQSENLK